MEAVAGLSTRLASTCVWLFIFGATLSYCSNVCLWSQFSTSPVKLLVLPFVSSKFFGSTLLFSLYSQPVLLLQWWFCLQPKTTPNALLSKFAGRLPGWRAALWIRTPYQALKACVLTAATACCGWFFVQSFADITYPVAVPENLWFIGIPTGCAHALAFLTSGAYVVEYPIMHRKRWLRLKDKAPAVLAMAATSWIYGTAAATMLFFLLPSRPSLTQLWASVLGSAACCLLWAFGSVVTGIVLSERLFLTHYEDREHFSVLAMLVERLTVLKDPIDEALTLQEIYVRSNFYGLRFWDNLFKEHMGTDLWQPLATHCLGQLDELCKTLSLFMTSQNTSSKDAKTVRWNARGVANMRSLPGPSKEQLYVEEWLQRRGQVCCWCAHIVTDVVCLSRGHDTYGLLQMPPAGVPGFADAVALLLHSYALLDKFMLYRSRTRKRKWLSWLPLTVGQGLGIIAKDSTLAKEMALSTSSGHIHTDALHDCTLQCLQQIVNEFGNAVSGALTRSKWAPPVTDKALDLASVAAAIQGG